MKEEQTEVLNLPMRKVHALEILKGTKVREYRAFSDHWAQRLCITEGDEVIKCKQFKKIHFYPLNQKWYLDVEFDGMGLYQMTAERLKELADEVTAVEDQWLFIIKLGKVIDTNLTL